MMHPQEKYGKEVIEMLQSFNEAVQRAGGAILSAKALRTMTAEDIILLLASNGVRFRFENKKHHFDLGDKDRCSICGNAKDDEAHRDVD
jgi:hypothetical protein